MKRNHITWTNFKTGDVIITLGGDKCAVLDVRKTKGVFARSCFNNLTIFQGIVEIDEAKRKDWRFIQPDGMIPMKLSELEKFVSNRVTIIK